MPDKASYRALNTAGNEMEDVVWELGIASIISTLAYAAYAIFRARRTRAASGAQTSAPAKSICCAHSSWCTIHYAANHGKLVDCSCGLGGSTGGHVMRLK
jgi:hypothetical protein